MLVRCEDIDWAPPVWLELSLFLTSWTHVLAMSWVVGAFVLRVALPNKVAPLPVSWGLGFLSALQLAVLLPSAGVAFNIGTHYLSELLH
jgi:hypothetical protein